MRSNPAGYGWLQALADNGQWVPPYELDGYDFTDRLPRGLQLSPTMQALEVPDQGRMRMFSPEDWNSPVPNWSDIPDWLQALNDDQEYARGRVLNSPYDGWGGGAMQARRRGLR